MKGVLSYAELSNIKKVLIIQLGPIGDALLTTSYFQTLKKKIPGVKIHYLIFKKYLKAIHNHPLIDFTICLENRSGINYYTERINKIIEIRKKKYDLVIDQQNMPSTQLITLLSGAKYRLGYIDGRFNFAYNLKALRGKLRYSASKKFDILSPLGITEEKYKLFFHISDEAKKYIHTWMLENNLTENSFVCISPGSPVLKKKWRLSNYIDLADKIFDKLNLQIVIVWAPNEKNDAEEIQKKMKSKSFLAPPTNLEEISSLIQESQLLICNDGGLNHLAVAVGADTLAIFGRTDPVDWSPAGEFESHHHIYNSEINNETKDDSFGISVEEVFNKVKAILSLQND